MKRMLRSAAARLLTYDRVVRYLFALARIVVRRRRPTVIAVTGSAGKTTTTAMLTAVLSHPDARARLGTVAGTRHNMNSYTGLPLTLLGRDEWMGRDPARQLLMLAGLPWDALRLATFAPYPRVLVLEVAAGWLGQVERLVELVRPTVGVVTNIGPSHLERFGDLDGVFREKQSVVSRLPSDGLAVVGDGHDYVDALVRVASAPAVVAGGRGPEQGRAICHAVARHLGIPSATVDAALATFEPPRGRLNVVAVGPLTVIDDSYNANPLSMRLGLDVLAERGSGARRLAFLGQMNELGAQSDGYHEEIGRYARERCDVLVGVGEQARHYRPDHWFATSVECALAAPDLVRPGDCLLVKGSASVEMSRVVAALRADVAAEAPVA